MTYTYHINPSMGMHPQSSNIYIPLIHRKLAREFYLSEKQRILEDCIKHPEDYLEG